MRFRLHYVHVITYDVTNVLMLLNRLNRLNRLHYGFEKFIYFCFQQKKIACIIEIIEIKLCHFFLSCTLCHFSLCHFFLVPFFPVPFFPVPFFRCHFFLHSSSVTMVMPSWPNHKAGCVVLLEAVKQRSLFP